MQEPVTYFEALLEARKRAEPAISIGSGTNPRGMFFACCDFSSVL